MDIIGTLSSDDDHPIPPDELVVEQEDYSSSSSYQQSSESSSEDNNQGDMSHEHQSSKRRDRISTPAEGIVDESAPSSGPSRRRYSRKIGADADVPIRSDAVKWSADLGDLREEDELRFQEGQGASRFTSMIPGASFKKRKPERLMAEHSKAKRLKGYYRDEYRQVLNATINQSKRLDDWETPSQLASSQIGSTYWSSSEKETFFEALGTLGRDNVRAISTIVRSKTELEVQQYTQLLIRGVESKNLTESPRKTMSLTDIPAAMQISEECCELLEKAADALMFHQERHEVKLEKAKWGDSWLLTSDVSDWVEDQLAQGENDDSLKEVLRSAELLKLRNWLELSTRIFMNPAPPLQDQNWQNLIEPGEVHGIRATAFGDFHRLTLSITKRLVSATIFCAMSRLRAMDPRSFTRMNMIKAKDVKAAAKTLGLELNCKKFWRDCPRRCHLDVYEKLQSSSVGRNPLSYDEVEAMLRSCRRPSRQSSGQLSGQSSAQPSGQSSGQSSHQSSRESSHESMPTVDSTEENSSAASETSYTEGHGDMEGDVGDDPSQQFERPLQRDLAYEFTKDESDQYGWPIDPSDAEFANPANRKLHALKKPREMETAERDQIRYAEAFDLRASLQEEQRLWAILNQDAPFAIRPDAIELPDRPTLKERELGDWREKLEYRSEWEVLRRPLSIKK